MTMTLAGYTLPSPTAYSREDVMDGVRRRALSGTYHFRAYSTAKKRSTFSITFDALTDAERNTVLDAWKACISATATFQDYDGNTYTVVASERIRIESAYASRYRVSMTLEQVP